MSNKKYPCVFGLKVDCEARRHVEESEAVVAEPSAEEKAVLEKAMKATKGLQFDDKETAKGIGEALAEGMFGKMLPAMVQGMKPNRAMIMSNFCGMCPTLYQERNKAMPCLPVRPPSELGVEE